ncbi:hypothetical protein BDZ97DRAFT_1649572, partial [Flammula alnicola]
PQAWRLTEYNPTEGNMEEIVFKLQGIVCGKMLPPVSKPITTAAMARQRPYIRQAVTVTGLGCDFFDSSRRGIEELYILYANNFPVDSLDGWQCGTYENFSSIDVHARYFSRITNNNDGADAVPFNSMVDPDGTLNSMIGDGYYHGPENMVEYRSRCIGRDEAVKYTHISPATIRIGDIVELSVTFAVFPCKDKRYKMVPQLRGVLLLNQEARDKAAILRMRSRFTPAPTQIVTSKRKPLYTDEEAVEETQRRLAKMNITQ